MADEQPEIKVVLVNFEDPNTGVVKDLLADYLNRVVLQKHDEQHEEIKFDIEKDLSFKGTYIKISGLTEEQQERAKRLSTFPSFNKVDFVD